MRLLIDASCINHKNMTASVPVYILRLVNAFLQFSSYEVILLIDYKQNKFFRDCYPNVRKYYVNRNFFLYRIPFIGSCYGRLKYEKVLKKINYDFEIIASDLDRCAKINSNHRRIFVIHDLKAIKDGIFWQQVRNKFFYRFMIKSSTFVVAISDYTRKDILQYYQVPEKRLITIPNSVEKCSNEKILDQIIPQKYILYVNTLLPHKNPITLIKAFERISDRIDCKLIIVGKTTSYWKSEIFPYIHNHNLLDSVIHLQNLSSGELQYLYNRASLFVTPSLREGFGYTPIEAAMSKVPVISSTSEALPYSTQGLLYYYEPADNPDVLANKILEVLSNPPTQEALNGIAKKFEQDYAPKKQVELFSQIIEKCKAYDS